MSENNTPEFVREDRYIVVKRTDLAKTPASVQEMGRYLERISNSQRVAHGKQPLECVVVEKDWPEFEVVWALIEARMTNKPFGLAGVQVTSNGEPVFGKLEEFNSEDLLQLMSSDSQKLVLVETTLNMAQELLRELSMRDLPDDLLSRIDTFLGMAGGAGKEEK